ncbi:MAG: NAD-dependent epimerase/dehydratase family protein [Candidatus Brocadiia bacterium]
MRTALITGGAGFIGSHLSERLLNDGWQVYVMDNLSTGRIVNLDNVRGHENLQIVLEGIENEQKLREMVDRADVVFHLAAAVGVKLIVDDPVRTIETNIYGTELLLKHCAVKGKKLVLASTSEVYGKGAREEFAEVDDLVFGPTTRSRWSYGCSKAIDEFLALAYRQSRDLPVLILRFFNTVGPRQIGRYGMVVPRFVRQALDGGPITVYGDGQQIRCFAHVNDVVGAVCSLTDTPTAEGQIFNVGSDRPVTIERLAETVRDLVNPDAHITHIPYEEAYGPGFEDIRRRVPCVDKLRETIGYVPDTSLERIIRDMSDFLESADSES